MDEGDGVLVAEGPAAVDDLLGAALHLGVVTLDGGEIEVLLAGAAGHGGGRAAAETDEHAGPAEDDEFIARADLALLDVAFADVAEAAGEHDRLVVAAELGGGGGAGGRGDFLLVGAEVAVDRGAAELVVEGGGAERAVEHDVEGGDDAAGLAVVLLPGLDGAGYPQVRYGEAGEAGLGLRAAAGGALVADLAAGAGGGAGPGGDGGRVVVGLDLAEDVDRLGVRGVFVGLRVGPEATADGAREDGGVVLVGGQDAVGVQVEGVLDHLEQRLVLGGAVDVPGGVEDLVAAVLGVGLREHHQLDVVRVAAERGEGLDEVVDLVVGEGEAEGGVGLDKGGAALREHRHARHGLGRGVAEKRGASVKVVEADLRHAVVDLAAEGGELGGAQDHEGLGERGVVDVEGELDHALDAHDLREAADVGDVGGLGGPGGNGARARRDDLKDPGDGGQLAAGAVGEELFENLVLFDRQGGDAGGELDHVDKLGADGANGQTGGGEIGAEFFQAKRREGGGAAEGQHGRENPKCFGRERTRSRGGAAYRCFRFHTGNFAEKAVDQPGGAFGMARF